VHYCENIFIKYCTKKIHNCQVKLTNNFRWLSQIHIWNESSEKSSMNWHHEENYFRVDVWHELKLWNLQAEDSLSEWSRELGWWSEDSSPAAGVLLTLLQSFGLFSAMWSLTYKFSRTDVNGVTCIWSGCNFQDKWLLVWKIQWGATDGLHEIAKRMKHKYIRKMFSYVNHSIIQEVRKCSIEAFRNFCKFSLRNDQF
jgi:hypothetical protein